jgi:hypothetical protein
MIHDGKFPQVYFFLTGHGPLLAFISTGELLWAACGTG